MIIEEKLKNDFLVKWKKYFPGAGLPITLLRSDSLNDATAVKKDSDHRCMMADMRRVFKGECLAFGAENIGCGGGLRYCGFAKDLRPGFEHFLSYGIPGKMKGERYKKDPKTVERMMGVVRNFENPYRWLIAKPFDQLTEHDDPEVIIFYATPDVLSGLFTLANYDRKDLYGVKAPFSAGCGSVVQYPMIMSYSENGDCFMGMYDVSARPYIPEGMVSFSIPVRRFVTLLGYMDECFLITDSWDLIRKRIAKSGDHGKEIILEKSEKKTSYNETSR
jgi:uncharacterized protein (DUF169 family)